MRKAIIYASIGLTILVLVTANSVFAAGWVTGYDSNYTVADNPTEIYGSNDQVVTNLGTDLIYTGRIMVIIEDEFGSGSGDDIIVYGYDVDSTSEEYEVYFGTWDNGPQTITVDPIGSAYDSDGTVGFEIGDYEETFNMVYLVATSGYGGSYPGPEIDAVYGVH
jgi:hypothetical protein